MRDARPRRRWNGSRPGAEAGRDRQSGAPVGAAAARAVVVIRLALVAAIGAGALVDQRTGVYGMPFFVVYAVTVLFALAAVALVVGWGRYGSYGLGLIDVLLLTALSQTSGGAESEVRFAFFAVPVLAAMLFSPRVTAIAGVAAVACYLTLALTHVDSIAEHEELVFVEVIYLCWTAVAAVLIAHVLTRRARTIASLAETRRALMDELLDGEERERRNLANWLHDGAVQNLIVVGQDLGDAQHGDRAALGRAREVVRATVTLLRNVLVDLYPGIVAEGRLDSALQAMADAQARQGGFAVDVTVDPRAQGVQDQLLLSLARELLINVAKHAQANRVTVSVTDRGDRVVLQVRDDGTGFDVAARADAVAAGHIGLASCAERVERLDGCLEIDSRPGQGTCVTAEVPRSS